MIISDKDYGENYGKRNSKEKNIDFECTYGSGNIDIIFRHKNLLNF